MALNPRSNQLGRHTWAEPVIGTTLSYAGYWYAFIALPIYQFILLRWGYRIIVWVYLLSEIARMYLHLTATHPDRAGGLGNSFQIIEEMKLVPMSRINLITALALNVIPALPLALTVMPLKDILHKLIQIFV